ncbi:protein neuralized isoform X1 [Periplaneta americana]|uniref:protein neuralized isoform X1 n=1 Tax=Periplaneta americana TaxID=6978 RepID=UPI0037E9B934
MEKLVESMRRRVRQFCKRGGVLLAPRSGSSGGTNNLPPILFHQVHGDNIRVSRDGTVARRAESFCKGVTFSSRPIKVAEKVCVKFLEVSNNWSGVIRFGFTCNDPNNLRYGLPKYACPDLTNKPGYWAKALAERFAERDTVLFYYVTQAGDVHFGINGEEKGVFFSGVETRGPLWAIIDVYGNSTAIELVDPRQQLNNSRRNLAMGGDASPGDSAAMERLILPSLTALSINQQNHQQPQSQRTVAEDATSNDMPGPRFQQPGTYFNSLPFHRTRGRNIRLSNDRCIASRTDTEFCHGYVFTARPIQLGEKVVIQVLATEPMYVGALAFGLTSCDPAMIQGADLPDDSDLLLDRPEYWVVSKDVASCPQRGDELSFCITHTGEVQFSKNGSTPVVFMHVDQTLQLWAFFDVYGSTQKIRILGSCVEPHHPHSSSGSRNSSPPPRVIDPALAAGRLRVNLPCSMSNGTSSNSSGSSEGHGQHNGVPVPVPVSQRFCCAGPTPPPTATAELVQYQPSVGGGTVLVVNLPPAHSNYLNQQNQQNQHQHQSAPAPVTTQHHVPSTQPAVPVDLQPSSSGTLLSTYSHTYIEPVSATSYSTLDSTATMQQWADATAATGGSGTECTICYERPIDSVLYMCGHMCMCYECAVQQWRGKGGGHCPLCRAVIRDVIRTYKS